MINVCYRWKGLYWILKASFSDTTDILYSVDPLVIKEGKYGLLWAFVTLIPFYFMIKNLYRMSKKKTKNV